MNLFLVLTFKGSLEKWTREGIANREMEIYVEYLRRNLFDRIQIFTYGVNDAPFLAALNFEESLKQRIDLIAPDRKATSAFGHLRHSLDLPKIRAAVKGGARSVKTNQINGCWSALLAKACGAKFMLRCGYLLSRRLFKNGQWIKGGVALLLEAISFNLASTISVTTPDARDYVRRLLVSRRDKVFVAPTYVNTDLFAPSDARPPKNKQVLFVGRLEPQKNILAMIEACALAQASLTLVGRGSLQDQALSRAAALGLTMTHYGSLTNEQIAALFKTHRIFLLPSLHEGLPKVLIEAMSCGMVCVGTPTSGTKDLVRDGETGYLAQGFTPQDIAAALRQAFEDPNDQRCAEAARRFVLENHTIAAYVDRESEKII